MVTNTPFLNTPYGGYLHSQVPSEDEEITHVGPGTLAGEWFRRFWQPVAVSEDLKDLPVAIRILGEDLVLFRDRSGQIGLLELHCSHRGTSLEFGQIEERGIRRCYHAWHYDVDGKLLETPGECRRSAIMSAQVSRGNVLRVDCHASRLGYFRRCASAPWVGFRHECTSSRFLCVCPLPGRSHG